MIECTASYTVPGLVRYRVETTTDSLIVEAGSAREAQADAESVGYIVVSVRRT
jgi:hypothetical protein